MELVNNVIEFDRTPEVTELLNVFISKTRLSSENTASSYEKHIKDFLEIVWDGKATVQLLNTVSIREFDIFTQELNKKGLKAATINAKVEAMKSFLKHLYDYEIITSIAFFDRLKSLKDGDAESHGVLSMEHFEKLLDLCLDEKVNAEAKYCCFFLMAETGIRKQAILDVKISDFKRYNNQVVLKTVDKNSKIVKKVVSLDLYERIKNLNKLEPFKGLTNINEIFNRLMDKIIGATTRKENRIVVHSIRKLAGTIVYKSTNDIMAASRFLGHSDTKTTQIYLESEDMQDGAVTLYKKNYDLYKAATHEELLEVISKLPKTLQMQINNELAKL